MVSRSSIMARSYGFFAALKRRQHRLRSETETPVEAAERPDAGKQRPCLLLVALHLHDERIETVEFQFVAQMPEEGDGGDFAVKIPGKVEKEGFEQGGSVRRDRRPPAVAGDAVIKAAIGTAEAHGVDPVAQFRF